MSVNEKVTVPEGRSRNPVPPRRIIKGLEGEGDGFFGGYRPTLLPRLGEGRLVELGVDDGERCLVLPCEVRQHGGADLFEQGLRTGEEPRGRFRSSSNGEGASATAELCRDSMSIAQVTVDA